MTQSKISKWVRRSALAVVACAAFAMVSAEQAQAQYYGGRGFGSFGRGLSINIGGGGFNRGFGGFNSGFGGFNSGFGGFNSGFGRSGFNSGFYSPQRSYYRGGGYYGGGRGYGGGRSYYRRY